MPLWVTTAALLCVWNNLFRCIAGTYGFLKVNQPFCLVFITEIIVDFFLFILIVDKC